MRRLMVLLTLLLSGCTSDHYNTMPGVDPLAMNSSLKSCKNEALSTYQVSQTKMSPIELLAGGLVGGGIGGFVLGAARGISNSESGVMPASGINPYIEQCMAARGYIGTSEN